MPRLSNDQRLRSIGMLEAGMDQRDVARIMHCHQRTISELLQRYRQTGSVADRPRSGRPKVTTERQDRYIQLTHLRDRFLRASQIAAVTIGTHGNAVCNETIRRRLKNIRLQCRRPLKGPELTEAHRATRRQWTQQRMRWTFQRCV